MVRCFRHTPSLLSSAGQGQECGHVFTECFCLFLKGETDDVCGITPVYIYLANMLSMSCLIVIVHSLAGNLS